MNGWLAAPLLAGLVAGVLGWWEIPTIALSSLVGTVAAFCFVNIADSRHYINDDCLHPKLLFDEVVATIAVAFVLAVVAFISIWLFTGEIATATQVTVPALAIFSSSAWLTQPERGKDDQQSQTHPVR